MALAGWLGCLSSLPPDVCRPCREPCDKKMVDQCRERLAAEPPPPVCDNLGGGGGAVGSCSAKAGVCDRQWHVVGGCWCLLETRIPVLLCHGESAEQRLQNGRDTKRTRVARLEEREGGLIGRARVPWAQSDSSQRVQAGNQIPSVCATRLFLPSLLVRAGTCCAI